MRTVVQRVRRAAVHVGGQPIGQIGAGLLALVAARQGDAESDAVWTAEKLANLRVFEDADGKMNRSLLHTGGAALVVSQFTLYGDARKGRRPSFVAAARPEVAAPLVDRVVADLRAAGVVVATGQFGAHMEVSLVNDGPVTLILESPSTAEESAP